MPKIRTGLIIIVTCIIACAIILVCETKQVIDYRGFPEPPSNLDGYFLSASTYRLVWSNNSENETGFDIHRSQGIIWSRLATVPGNTESYIDSLQQDSTTYSYFATAFNASGNSTASNIHSATVSTFGSPPDRPQNPSPQDQSKIHNLATDLRWECSDPDGDPLSYDIYFGTDSDPSLLEANLASNTYSISELRPGTSYNWRIVARDVYSYETSSPIWSLIISELVLLGNYDIESYPRDVFVSTDHAYMIDITPTLIIIDISDSRSPALASVFSLPNRASDIFVADGHAYVADSHSGLLIIDISNPASPTSEGSYDTSGRVQGVFVIGDYAYVTGGGPPVCENALYNIMLNAQSMSLGGPMKRTVILRIVSLILLLTWHSTPARSEPRNSTPELPYANELLAVLNQGIEANNGTGVSAAVIVPGYAPWAGVAGVSNRASGEVLEPDMLFLAASIGKNYVAALVLRLAEAGQISLPDSLGKWITKYPNLSRQITVRQLLNHTSGLPDFVKHPNSPYQTPYASIDFAKSWTSEEILATLPGKPLSQPGEGWHYSTTNYVLLKIIVEQTTGSTVPTELRKRMLDPLGLKSTVPLADSTIVPPGFEIAHNWYDVDADGILDDISSDPKTWLSISPHIIFTTAEDLARWSDALFREHKVLSEKYVGEMLTFHSPISDPREPLIVGYGLGTAEFPSNLFDGDRVIGHLGWDFGWIGAMLFFPERSVSVAILMNDNNEPCITHIATGLWAAIKEHLTAND